MKEGWKLPKQTQKIKFHNNTFATINKNGFRVTSNREKNINSKTKKLVVIGDSFAFGEEVNDEHSLPFLLSDSNPNLEVYNLATSGYGHGQMLISLERQIEKINPDYVLLVFIETDMYRTLMDFRDYAKPNFFLTDHLKLNNKKLLPPHELRQEKALNFFLL